MAHANASEPHATAALAHERLIDQRRPQDDSAPRDDKRRGTEEHDEARDGTTQDDREAQHRQTRDREARYRKTRHGKAGNGEAKEHDAASERRPLDREADGTAQLFYT